MFMQLDLVSLVYFYLKDFHKSFPGAMAISPPLFSWWFKALSKVERQTLNIFPLFKHSTNYQCLVASALPSSIKFCHFFYVWPFCKVPNIKMLLRWLNTFCFQLTILRMNNPFPGCGGTHMQSEHLGREGRKTDAFKVRSSSAAY